MTEATKASVFCGQMILAIGPKGLWTIPSGGVEECPSIARASVAGAVDTPTMRLPHHSNTQQLNSTPDAPQARAAGQDGEMPPRSEFLIGRFLDRIEYLFPPNEPSER